MPSPALFCCYCHALSCRAVSEENLHRPISMCTQSKLSKFTPYFARWCLAPPDTESSQHLRGIWCRVLTTTEPSGLAAGSTLCQHSLMPVCLSCHECPPPFPPHSHCDENISFRSQRMTRMMACFGEPPHWGGKKSRLWSEWKTCCMKISVFEGPLYLALH